MADLPDVDRVRFHSEELADFCGPDEVPSILAQRIVVLSGRHDYQAIRRRALGMEAELGDPRESRLDDPSEISYTREYVSSS